MSRLPNRVVSLGVMSYPHDGEPENNFGEGSSMIAGPSLAESGTRSFPSKEARRIEQDRYRAKLENDKKRTIPVDRKPFARSSAASEPTIEGLPIGGRLKSESELRSEKVAAQESYRNMVAEAKAREPVYNERLPIVRASDVEEDTFAIGKVPDKRLSDSRAKEYQSNLKEDIRLQADRQARIAAVE